MWQKITAFVVAFVFFTSPFLRRVKAEIIYWSTDVDLGAVDASFQGESANDNSGYFGVSGVGDVNGDGYDDFAIGADGRDSNAGETYLFFGDTSGWSMDMSLADADASFEGEAAGNLSGYAVSGVGDVNKDGYDDFVIGAYARLASGGAGSEGETYLILGKASGWSMNTSLSTADASFEGETANDNSGKVVAGGGDVNGDTYPDILIGAPGYDDGINNSVGKTYVIFGKELGWAMDTSLAGSDASYIGEVGAGGSMAISGAGDIDGDGYGDILIGNESNDENGASAGQAYIVFGKAAGWANNVSLASGDPNIASVLGEDEVDLLGNSVSGAGDVNGDGTDDFLIAAKNDEDVVGFAAGQTYLFFGADSGWAMDMAATSADASFLGENSDDKAGTRVRGVGDANGDGYDDFVITAPGWENGWWAGKAYLVLGGASGWALHTSLSTADASFEGESSDDWDSAGEGLGAAGDINNDGYDDFLVGSAWNCESASSAGQTYLILGGTDLYQVDNLDASLDVEDISSNNIEDGTPSGLVGANTARIRTSAGYLLADVSADFTADLDWTGVTGAVDTTDKKAVISGLDTAEGVGTTHTLYVPKNSADDSVGICETATSLAEVSENCTGLEVKDETDSDVSIVTEGGQDYWKVEGLENTGGFSFVYNELYPDVEDEDNTEELVETGTSVWFVMICAMGILGIGCIGSTREIRAKRQ